VAKAPEIVEDDMNVMFNTNVTGLINMTQAILPIFLKRPDGGMGDIINIGSIAGTGSLSMLCPCFPGKPCLRGNCA
jgi:3-hydroxy acid dehydrogenase/malonic semialdehyde reductase